MRNLESKLIKFIFWHLMLIINLLLWNCAIAMSPHAQNEMVTPYNPEGKKGEIGSAFAINKWNIHQGEDTIYIRNYPVASLSLFSHVYFYEGKFGGFGGVELISSHAQSWVSDASGFFLWLKPYLGFQYNKTPITCRLNFSPINIGVSYGDGELGFGFGYNKPTLYQLSILLHNNKPSKNIYWVGVRSSLYALGFVGGYEYSFNAFNILRVEYSYLIPPIFSPFLEESEFESIRGSVHYITIGFFKRIK